MARRTGFHQRSSFAGFLISLIGSYWASPTFASSMFFVVLEPVSGTNHWLALSFLYLDALHTLPHTVMDQDGPDNCYLIEQPRTTMVTVAYSYPSFSKQPVGFIKWFGPPVVTRCEAKSL